MFWSSAADLSFCSNFPPGPLFAGLKFSFQMRLLYRLSAGSDQISGKPPGIPSRVFLKAGNTGPKRKTAWVPGCYSVKEWCRAVPPIPWDNSSIGESHRTMINQLLSPPLVLPLLKPPSVARTILPAPGRIVRKDVPPSLRFSLLDTTHNERSMPKKMSFGENLLLARNLLSINIIRAMSFHAG